MYTSILNNASVCIYPPDVYHTILKRIYEIIGIKTEIIKSISPGIHEKSEQTGRVNVSIRPDHNQALLNVEVIGINTLDEIRFHLKQLCLNHIECIYADLPLFSKQSGVLGAQLRKMGFFFGGVIPVLRDGDILRMQYLNNVEISRDDIAIASDFGRTLLDFIFEDRTSVVG
jgi:serine/threonine-protein kinase RsbW